MNYRIILKCINEKDAQKFDRDLHLNSFEGAQATFKSLVKTALDNLIDPYIIEFYYGQELRYKLEVYKI